MNTKIKDLMSQMTIQEKASLLSGFDYWTTKGIERLGIPALSMADGPHGLRKQMKNELGIGKSHPATCFPTAALLACSWDEELAFKQGESIGREARELGLSCVLGPGINIKRSPLCGRNFEYFSEDPLLSGRMGAGIVNGIQSRGVSACLKHFAVNNQEEYRLWVDARVDEKTLREIYLASFEYALMYSKPKAVMCGYNKVNGVYASENRRLLTDILRGEWGYKGIVMSDWGAVNNRPQGVWAGLDLEMPGSFGVNDAEIVKAATGITPFMDSTDPDFDNTLTEKEIDVCVERMLNFIFDLEETLTPLSGEGNPAVGGIASAGSAREIASECMVLLENDGVLPLEKGCKIAVVGDIAVNPVYQGAGSSRIVPTAVDIPLDCLNEYSDATYVADVEKDKKVISKADAVVFFAGMPDEFDAEGTDRESMSLPAEQYETVERLRLLNDKVVVVVCAGAPVEMFGEPPSAMIMAYLGGQGMGGAVADLLFGVKNPCGKLAETFPTGIEDTPSYVNFPGDGDTVNYGEGVYVGYRWCNKLGIEPRYRFGYGLSYTTFEYDELSVSGTKVTVDVANTGDYDGKEVVQLFINGELADFKKVMVKKGESVTVEFALTSRAFSRWSVKHGGFFISGGYYKIEVGTLTGTVYMESDEPPEKVTLYTQIKALYHIPNGMDLFREIGELFNTPITEELVETRDCSSFVGNILRNVVTMYDTKWTFEDLKKRIDKVNEMNKV
ncbi:MAG: glycoside hydrolase family 3 C-terminal domain-containing protein [Oscillospiraceae bacterium]|nr:glycoside hydrolase family 3 C-terminal domain-containing protein [Oscillospiraceae bacterium]